MNLRGLSGFFAWPTLFVDPEREKEEEDDEEEEEATLRIMCLCRSCVGWKDAIQFAM